MHASRRDAIRLGALGSAGLLLPTASGAVARAATRASGQPSASGPPSIPPFSVRLAVPRVLRPVRRTATTDHYRVTAKKTNVQIFPGVWTPMLGHEGAFPGPTIHATTGRRVEVTHVNALDRDISVHLHGGHTPTTSDGYPTYPIAPGASRVYTYANRQEAATLWYHDHAMMNEAENNFLGLSGLYLLSDAHESSLRLPSGPYDVPLMLRDARFDDNGAMVFEMDDFQNRNTILVNGRPQPYLPVAARRYRFRVCNSSNLRYFTLRLAPGGEMLQIASDGGLLPAPVPATSVTLSPGERVELVIDFSAYPVGKRVVLANDAFDAPGTDQVMAFDVVGRARDTSRVPAVLRPSLPDLGAETQTRTITMGLDLNTKEFTMDGKAFDIDRVDQQVKFGATEVWKVTNTDALLGIKHNIHLHGVQFQVLDRDGLPVYGHERGWKDTVSIPPGSTVRFKVRFDQYTGRYLYHCHLLDHAAMGMMAQMEINR